MGKLKVIIDFDGVLTDSVSKICDILNTRYKMNLSQSDIRSWNFEEYPVSKEEIEDIFNSGTFFYSLEDYIMPHVKEVLNLLSKDFELICCSVGNYNNIANKAIFIHDNFPMIKSSILISKDEIIMDKSSINMKDAILIDDSISNLNSSNAKYKLLFSKDNIKTNWNNYSDETIGSWEEVYLKLMGILGDSKES